MVTKKTTTRVNGRIWIETGKGPVLGYGRIELLEKIKKHGSITKAASGMKMSYSQAWELIDSMNENSDKPLVLKQTGGKGGGGAVITAYGERLLSEFKELNKRFQLFLKAQSLNLNHE